LPKYTPYLVTHLTVPNLVMAKASSVSRASMVAEQIVEAPMGVLSVQIPCTRVHVQVCHV